jgi:CIC family chloride channel protein
MTGVVWISGIRDLLDRSGESSPIMAGDLATAAGTVLRPEDDLDVALRSLVEEDVEELPVTAAGDPRRVVGLLSRRDLLAAYDVRRAGPAAPVSGVPWAESPP